MFFWLFLTSLISLLVGAALMRRFGMTHTIYKSVNPYYVDCYDCALNAYARLVDNARGLCCERHRLKGFAHHTQQQVYDVVTVDWSTRPAPASVVETPTTLKENA